MRIIKIENEKINFVAIPNENENTQKEFVKNNDGYILTDFNFEAGKVYKYTNGKIVEDTEAEAALKNELIQNKIIEYLSNTDYLMLIDNPAGLSDTDLETVKKFRADLRAATDTIPEIPDILKGKL